MDFGRRVVLGDFVYRPEHGQAGALYAQRRSRDYAARRRIGRVDPGALRTRRHDPRAYWSGRFSRGVMGSIFPFAIAPRVPKKKPWSAYGLAKGNIIPIKPREKRPLQ